MSGNELSLAELMPPLILIRFVHTKRLGQPMLSTIKVNAISFPAHLHVGKCYSGSGTSLPLRRSRRAWFLRLVTSRSPAQADRHCGNCRQLPPVSWTGPWVSVTGSGIQAVNDSPSRSDGPMRRCRQP